MKSKENSPASQPETQVESLTFEEALDQLEEIINTLELGEQTLDQSLAFYERGQVLARRCAYLIDQAELKVKLLSGEELVDFES
jgi:exodeoxyribonuclease VII small subunit